jgi:hypothetical protein
MTKRNKYYIRKNNSKKASSQLRLIRQTHNLSDETNINE